MKKRVGVPARIQRRLLIEAGYQCSIPHCRADSALEFHHIDGNPSNNAPDNILVVCSNHHAACTKGRIDKKACAEIKGTLASTKINLSSSTVSGRQIRKILKDELTWAGLIKGADTGQPMFASPFDRKYLFQILAVPFRDPYELYAALRVLGSLRPRGATQRIINTVSVLRKYPRRMQRRIRDKCYIASVQSLGQIGTRSALRWLAEEIVEDQPKPWIQIMAYGSLASSARAKEHVGFKIVHTRHPGYDEINGTFRAKGKGYDVSMRFTPAEHCRPAKQASRLTRSRT